MSKSVANRTQLPVANAHIRSALAIEEQIRELPTLAVAGGERRDAVDNVLGRLSRLNQEIQDAEHLPAYDIRNYVRVGSFLSCSMHPSIVVRQSKRGLLIHPPEHGRAPQSPR